MTYAQEILDYLWSIAPGGASNRRIAGQLGIRSHQTVYMITQDLLRRSLIHGLQEPREWVFYAVDEAPGEATAAVLADLTPAEPAIGPSAASGNITPIAFEAMACRALSVHYGVALAPGSVSGVQKRFDLVSLDRQVVGDAKYYTRVRGIALPPGKFSVIAEYVWLLEKTRAPTTFLVFGNDRQVPVQWLHRYGNFLSGTAFYFLADDGRLEQLA